ncbi:MAG TPA: CcoQ/FixQ family Cbb3-type cytochrome c oxidase assembly chaperone [Polyangia bacterium]|jgi:cbb3-type cytochrome oxidase subunit 3|nr:CcoQ/FixQ family Cbb3-type cytochrome c oxidase assembly chaperone [Polyangia bacterium]
MFAQFYSGMHWSALPIFALLLFLATFLTVVVRTLLPSRRAQLDQQARLPLEGESVEMGDDVVTARIRRQS